MPSRLTAFYVVVHPNEGEATMPTGRQRLMQAAVERDLRRSTVVTYERWLARLGALDVDATKEDCLERLYDIDGANSRRQAVVVLRTVYGWPIKIPKAVPRRYNLADEDTYRLALMTSPHEVRGLLMMYAGLRLGEACAITSRDLEGDRLTVDKQVTAIHKAGVPTRVSLGPTKGSVGQVVIPYFLAPQIACIEATAHPDGVRESLRRAGRKVGISLNPHQLRHFYATHLITHGVPINIVSQQMRHSDVAVTLRTYVQVDAGRSVHDLFDGP